MNQTGISPYQGANIPRQVSLTYLGRWRRLGATLIELALWLAIHVFLGTVSYGLLTVPLVVANIAYLAFFWWYFGGSIGHLALGARVVNLRNGGPLSPGQSTGRAAVFILDVLLIPLVINCIMVLTRPDRRHLYDLMVGTVVVYDHRANGDRWTRIAPR